MSRQSQRLVDPSMDTLLEGLLAKTEGDTGRVPALSGQGKALQGGDGANWGYCLNNWSGNALTRPPCPKVRGITIGSLLESSKASLTTPSEASLQDAQHTSPPPPQPSSFLNWATTVPRICTLVLLLSPLHPLSFSG